MHGRIDRQPDQVCERVELKFPSLAIHEYLKPPGIPDAWPTVNQ
jgi:hypothetical protein